MEEIIKVIGNSPLPPLNLTLEAKQPQESKRNFPQKRISNIKWWGEEGMRSGSVLIYFDYFLHLP